MSLASAIVVVVLTALTALYVAAEFAAVSVRRSRVRQLAEDGHWLALRLLPFIEDAHQLDHYIAASQIGITLTSLIIGAYGQAAITPDLAALAHAVGPGRRAMGAVGRERHDARDADHLQRRARRAGAEVAGAAAPDAGGAGHGDADAVVAVDLRPVHPRPERQRPPRAAAARDQTDRPSPRAFARGARAADRREPRRRPARAGRASPSAARAAAAPAHRARADGARGIGSRPSTSRARFATCSIRCRSRPTRACRSTERRTRPGRRHPQHQAARAATTARHAAGFTRRSAAAGGRPRRRRLPAIGC